MTSRAGELSIERRSGALPPELAAEVLALADTAAAADRTYPFSEQVVLRLRRDGDQPTAHVLTRDRDHQLTGYGQLDLADGATAELVVLPQARHRGIGTSVLTEAVATAARHAAAGEVRVWAHGDHPAAAGLARAVGFTRVRVLQQLRRSLRTPVPEPALPDGVRLRSFQPDADEQAWLELNARAFADHPEQGRITLADLRDRMAEPWFDPAGFLLAVRESDGQLVGFHWTKVHGEGNWHSQQPIGEVYVVGVDPAAHGSGLGTALTLAGLAHLRERGLGEAMLFVDGDNAPALALYGKLGFADHSIDVMYSRTA